MSDAESFLDPQLKFKHLSEYPEKNFMMNVAEIFPKLTIYNCNAIMEEISKNIDAMVVTGFIDNEFHYYLDKSLDVVREFIESKMDASPYTSAEILKLKHDIMDICLEYFDKIKDAEYNNNFKENLLKICIDFNNNLVNNLKKNFEKLKNDINDEEVKEWHKINIKFQDGIGKLISINFGSCKLSLFGFTDSEQKIINAAKTMIASINNRFNQYKMTDYGLKEFSEAIKTELKK